MSTNSLQALVLRARYKVDANIVRNDHPEDNSHYTCNYFLIVLTNPYQLLLWRVLYHIFANESRQSFVYHTRLVAVSF